MAELEELEQEDLDEQLLEVGPATDQLPSVPSTEPVAPGGLCVCSIVCIYCGPNQNHAKFKTGPECICDLAWPRIKY